MTCSPVVCTEQLAKDADRNAQLCSWALGRRPSPESPRHDVRLGGQRARRWPLSAAGWPGWPRRMPWGQRAATPSCMRHGDAGWSGCVVSRSGYPRTVGRSLSARRHGLLHEPCRLLRTPASTGCFAAIGRCTSLISMERNAPSRRFRGCRRPCIRTTFFAIELFVPRRPAGGCGRCGD